MLFYTFTILIYSLVMYYVFYKLPYKYNMIAFNKYGQKKVDVHSLKMSKTMIERDGNMDELMEYEEEAREFEASQMKNSSVESQKIGSMG